MKTIKLNKILLLALSLVVFSACVQDDDFDTPNVDVVNPVINGNIIDIDATALTSGKAIHIDAANGGQALIHIDKAGNKL